MATTHALKPQPQQEQLAIQRALRRIGDYVGLPLDAPMDIDRAGRDGLPIKILDLLVRERDYTKREFSWAVSPRSLFRHKVNGGKLNLDESFKILRAARLTLMAEEVFGDEEKARRWMHEPREALEGMSAMEAMQTEVGGQQVEELLGQIESGYCA